jgi:hypothetical protein
MAGRLKERARRCCATTESAQGRAGASVARALSRGTPDSTMGREARAPLSSSRRAVQLASASGLQAAFHFRQGAGVKEEQRQPRG